MISCLRKISKSALKKLNRIRGFVIIWYMTWNIAYIIKNKTIQWILIGFVLNKHNVTYKPRNNMLHYFPIVKRSFINLLWNTERDVYNRISIVITGSTDILITLTCLRHILIYCRQISDII